MHTMSQPTLPVHRYEKYVSTNFLQLSEEEAWNLWSSSVTKITWVPANSHQITAKAHGFLYRPVVIYTKKIF